jgi:hypothetical protein
MNLEYRAEIISNQSVEEDIIELLEEKIPTIEYTIIPTVSGKGGKTQKLGNTIWPEQNFVLFTYLDKENAKILNDCVKALIKRFPNEGISLFFTLSQSID